MPLIRWPWSSETKQQAMIDEIRADFRVVHVIFGMFGVGCQVRTVTGDILAEVRGHEDEATAVRAAWEKWKAMKGGTP